MPAMAPSPKPGWLLVGSSIVLIAFGALAVSAILAAILIASDIPSGAALLLIALTGLLVCALLMVGATWQYRGTFCGDNGAAGRAAGLAGLGSLILWPVAFATLVIGATTVLLDPERLLGFLGWAALTMSLAGYATFTAWINLRWSRRLAAAGVSPRPRQFSIRDLLAITIWIAMVAGVTRWIVIASR
jgi:hypothetical protein